MFKDESIIKVRGISTHTINVIQVGSYLFYSNTHIYLKNRLNIRRFLSIFQKCNQFVCSVNTSWVMGIFIP